MRGRRVAAVIVAAGTGERLGREEPKGFVPLAGRRMVSWSIEALEACDRVESLIVVVPAGGTEWARAALGRDAARVTLVEGGASRAVSVARGVSEAPSRAAFVLVHDAARPLLAPAMAAAVIRGVGDADGAIAAHPVSDTLKASVAGSDRIGRTVPREGLWVAQTPQVFRSDPFREAIGRAIAEDSIDSMTDCASVMEAAGRSVNLVPVAGTNLKVTTPADLAVAEALLGARSADSGVD